MIEYAQPGKSYMNVWSKYRPAILKLMVDAAKGPQQYKFSPHEFKNVNSKEKGGHSFTLRAFQGKASNSIKGSVIAKDLLELLNRSNKAMELTKISTYEFVLDKQYMFRVTLEQPAEPLKSPEATLEASAT